MGTRMTPRRSLLQVLLAGGGWTLTIAMTVTLTGCGAGAGTAAPTRTVTVTPTPSAATTSPSPAASATVTVTTTAQPHADSGEGASPGVAAREGPTTGRRATAYPEQAAGRCGTPDHYGLLTMGQRGRSVATLQCLLDQAGEDVVVDGVFGEQTAIAYARVVERALGESPQSPDVMTREWIVLYAAGPTPRLTRGSRGEAVRRVQRAIGIAVSPIPVDGIFGEQTDAAVREYQSLTGHTVDGVVGPATWRALQTGEHVGD